MFVVKIPKDNGFIFDCDVDTDWVENLSSVLDDNRLLKLLDGECLSIPSNVRIIFDVSDLKYAILATLSRCGMIWLLEEVINKNMLYESYLNKLRNQRLGIETSRFSTDNNDFFSYGFQQTSQTTEIISMETSIHSSLMMAVTFNSFSSNVNSPFDTITSRVLEVQRMCANTLSRHMKND